MADNVFRTLAPGELFRPEALEEEIDREFARSLASLVYDAPKEVSKVQRMMRGLEPHLERFRPLAIVEVLPVYDARSEIGEYRLKRQQEVEQLLKRSGYVILQTKPPNGWRLLDEIGIHGDMDLTDYLFLPSERLAGC